MKNLKSNFLLIIILISFFTTTTVIAQFTGKMKFTYMDKVRTFNVYFSNDGYRYDFDENGQKGAVIVKKDSKEVIILMPQQKMAMKSAPGNPMSMANDPLQSFEYYKDSGLFKDAGEETVNGIPCNKSILYNKDNPSQKMFTMWYSNEYKFPMKMINHIDGSEDSGMEMIDVKPWKPDPSMFEIPSGFNVMDMPTMPSNK